MTMPTLDDICAYLKETWQPRAILLHGSRASGAAASNSDYDMALVVDDPDAVMPCDYQGAMLDLSGLHPDAARVETTSKTPCWPVIVLHDDAAGAGAGIAARTETAFLKGPAPLTPQEWRNRANYTQRLMHKISDRGADEALRRYYLSDLYPRLVRYWFEKKNRWTLPAHRALPAIAAEDHDFYKNLAALWSAGYLSAIKNLQKALFD